MRPLIGHILVCFVVGGVGEWELVDLLVGGRDRVWDRGMNEWLRIVE
jgi:hypothetical protein